MAEIKLSEQDREKIRNRANVFITKYNEFYTDKFFRLIRGLPKPLKRAEEVMFYTIRRVYFECNRLEKDKTNSFSHALALERARDAWTSMNERFKERGNEWLKYLKKKPELEKAANNMAKKIRGIVESISQLGELKVKLLKEGEEIETGEETDDKKTDDDEPSAAFQKFLARKKAREAKPVQKPAPKRRSKQSKERAKIKNNFGRELKGMFEIQWDRYKLNKKELEILFKYIIYAYFNKPLLMHARNKVMIIKNIPARNVMRSVITRRIDQLERFSQEKINMVDRISKTHEKREEVQEDFRKIIIKVFEKGIPEKQKELFKNFLPAWENKKKLHRGEQVWMKREMQELYNEREFWSEEYKDKKRFNKAISSLMNRIFDIEFIEYGLKRGKGRRTNKDRYVAVMGALEKRKKELEKLYNTGKTREELEEEWKKEEDRKKREREEQEEKEEEEKRKKQAKIREKNSEKHKEAAKKITRVCFVGDCVGLNIGFVKDRKNKKWDHGDGPVCKEKLEKIFGKPEQDYSPRNQLDALFMTPEYSKYF